ncbi:MAG: tetratricopeptide repeat protein, partial [Desulfobulbaceae bacterium]|nr:tetratricopeptide repeat protein [Desulfobulbaceae bacterium]
MGDFYQSPRLPQQTVIFSQEGGPPWVSLWQNARRLAREGDYRAALNQYELFLRNQKDAVQPRWEMASILLAQHEFDRAAALLEMLLEEFPEQVDYLNGLGYAMQETGRFDRAVELFEQAEQIDPENLITLTGMSESLLSLGQLQDALPYLEKLYARRTEDVGLCEKLVHVYEQLGLYDRAQPLAVRLADRKNASVANFKVAAGVCSALGQDKLAERYWSRLLDKSPLDASAHAWLATHLEEKGDCREALEHLLFLLDQDKENPDLLVRTGGCYLQIKEPAKALPYYEKYLEQFPGDKEISRQLVNIYGALGNESGTLAALDRYFRIEPDPSLSNLRRAARLYDGAGRYHEAIPLYRRLLARHPDDPELLGTMAQDLLAVGEDEGALATWAHLAAVSPDSKKIYRLMLDLLLRLDRPQELHDVLAQLHRLDPDDAEVTLRLASSFIAAGEMAQGETILQEVAAKELRASDLLLMRARIFESLLMADHALGDYEAALKSHDERTDLHLKALLLAASLGKLPEARRHYAALGKTPLNPPERLAVANAFRDGCDFDSAYAIYLEMTDDSGLDKGLRCQAYVELAASYELQGLFYEAEQALRLAFFADAGRQAEVMCRLVDLKLHSGLTVDAGVWLAQMRSEELLSPRDGAADDRDRLRKLMMIKQFNADGKYAAAMRKAVELQDELKAQGAAESYQGVPLADLAALELARAYLGMKEYEEAEKQGKALLERQLVDFPALLLVQQIYADQDNTEAAAGVGKRIMALAGKDLGRMLTLAKLYHETGAIAQMAQAASAARQMAPDSFSASFCLAKAYSSSGKLAQARDLINSLQRDYPENQAIQALAARVAFIMGFNQEAMSYCDSVLARYPDRADMELLKARVYWRKLEWKSSFKIYDDYLTPSASDLFVQQSSAAGLR